MTDVPREDRSLERRRLIAGKGGEGVELHVIPGKQKGICRNGHGIRKRGDKSRKSVVLAGDEKIDERHTL